MATGADAQLRARADRGFFGHPRGLATLFMTELWERFSYYGMRALLILFMTAPPQAGGLGFDVAKAGAIYGLYTAMVYLLSLPGGWAADRWLGQRRAVLSGGVLIAIGNFCLAIPSLGAFYSGLMLVACGTGLLKPNVSVMVGQLYDLADSRRDAGFSIFYMGINLGAFLAPLACGYVGQRINWHLGFALAGFGMLLGLTQYVAGSRHLGKAGLPPPRHGHHGASHKAVTKWLALIFVAFGALALAHAAGLVRLTAQALSDALGILLAFVVVGFFVWALFLGEWTREERRRLVVIGVLFLASAVFWGVFEQAGSTLNLFAERNTDRTVLGFTFPASWLQSLNALFIVALAPVFAWLWMRLGRREPSSPAKFAWGLTAAGLGFVVLAVGASVAEQGVRISPLWLVAVYLLHTAGELCLSPVGLSAMTKLAPARIGGLVMGVWFLSISVGNYIGGRIAALYEALPLSTLFGVVGATAVGAGVIMALLTGSIRKLMGDVK